MTTPHPADPDVPPRSPLRPGPVLATAGGVAVVVSGWITWVSGVDGAPGEIAFDEPARFLVDVDASIGGPSIGLLLLVVGFVVIAGAVVHGFELAAVIGGVVALLIAALFAFQLNRAVHQLSDEAMRRFRLTDFLALGVYVAAAGGVLAVVGGILSLRRP